MIIGVDVWTLTGASAEVVLDLRAQGHRVVLLGTGLPGEIGHLLNALEFPRLDRGDLILAQDQTLVTGLFDLVISDDPEVCAAARKAILYSVSGNRTYRENGTTVVRPIEPESVGGLEFLDRSSAHEDGDAQWRRIPYLATAMLAPRAWPTAGSQPGVPGYILPATMLEGVSIIAVSGKMHGGKSHFGRHLVQRGYTPIAYANPFKFPCVSHRGMPAAEVFGSFKSDEVRAVLQDEGTKKGREVPDIGEYVWLRALEAQIWYLIDSGVTRIAVTDCRFVNEAEHIKLLGGKIVRLYGRGGSENPEIAAHRSETELDGYEHFDLMLDNRKGREAEATEEFLAFLNDLQGEVAVCGG